MNINQLSIKGKQSFMGIEIPIVNGGFGENKRILFDKTISEIHGMETKEVRKSINRIIDKGRIKENIDYIDLKSEGGKQFTTLDMLLDIGYSKSAITQAKNIFVLSERGYTKLIKSMDDDSSWSTMDNLIDEYFQMKNFIESLDQIKAMALLDIYKGGSKAIEGARTLTEIEVKEATAPLIGKIELDAPLVDLAKARLDKNGLISITDATETFKVKKGKITKWAKQQGYLHKTNSEVNQLGKAYFKVYDSKGYRCIGINEDGLKLINDNIENIKVAV
jgi:hypothetical protein